MGIVLQCKVQKRHSQERKHMAKKAITMLNEILLCHIQGLIFMLKHCNLTYQTEIRKSAMV